MILLVPIFGLVDESIFRDGKIFEISAGISIFRFTSGPHIEALKDEDAFRPYFEECHPYITNRTKFFLYVESEKVDKSLMRDELIGELFIIKLILGLLNILSVKNAVLASANSSSCTIKIALVLGRSQESRILFLEQNLNFGSFPNDCSHFSNINFDSISSDLKFLTKKVINVVSQNEDNYLHIWDMLSKYLNGLLGRDLLSFVICIDMIIKARMENNFRIKLYITLMLYKSLGISKIKLYKFMAEVLKLRNMMVHDGSSLHMKRADYPVLIGKLNIIVSKLIQMTLLNFEKFRQPEDIEKNFILN